MPTSGVDDGTSEPFARRMRLERSGALHDETITIPLNDFDGFLRARRCPLKQPSSLLDQLIARRRWMQLPERVIEQASMVRPPHREQRAPTDIAQEIRRPVVLDWLCAVTVNEHTRIIAAGDIAALGRARVIAAVGCRSRHHPPQLAIDSHEEVVGIRGRVNVAVRIDSRERRFTVMCNDPPCPEPSDLYRAQARTMLPRIVDIDRGRQLNEADIAVWSVFADDRGPFAVAVLQSVEPASRRAERYDALLIGVYDGRPSVAVGIDCVKPRGGRDRLDLEPRLGSDEQHPAARVTSDKALGPR